MIFGIGIPKDGDPRGERADRWSDGALTDLG